MSKVAVLLDDDGQLQGIFSSFYNAAMTKTQLEKATDAHFGPIIIREVVLDELMTYKLRPWFLSSINIPSGVIGKTLEGKDFTNITDDYTSHVAANNQYIEVKSYLGISQLISTLKRLREEYLRKKNGSTWNADGCTV
jgi:hypothetical protein